MRSIRTRITMIIVIAIVLSTGIATALGMKDVSELGAESSEQSLRLLCENGQKNLDSYFDSVGQSVDMVASYAETDLEASGDKDLKEHIQHVNIFFNKVARQTNGVHTYYYRLDPSFTEDQPGFWYVDANGNGFTEHEVTDITQYDLNDTTKLVWYTIPRASGKAVWLPPYITDNLDVRVISYNVPVYYHDRFVGVIGIEINYETMADQVDNIRLYENGYAFLNDTEGDLIYHPTIDVLTLPAEQIPKTPEELTGYAQYIEYTFEGVEKKVYRLKLKNGMILNVSVPVSEVNGPWQKMMKRTIWVSIGLLVIFVLLAWQFASHIIRPLTDLTKAAKKVDAGDYDVELKYGGRDEVGVLTSVFRSLIDHLKAYISDLNNLNSKLQEDNLTLEAATIRDSLTGVKNRFALRRDYDTYYEKDLHLLMLDIDDFKSVNDNYGHSIGDYLLKKTGDALLDNFGAEYSYRYGGDEFIVIIPDVDEAEFQKTLALLTSQLEEIYLEDKKLPVHFSAGYVYGKSVLRDDLRLMLREADMLLYQAKGNGKNTFIGDVYNRETAEGIKKREAEDFRQG